jgi:hypothetical protein
VSDSSLQSGIPVNQKSIQTSKRVACGELGLSSKQGDSGVAQSGLGLDYGFHKFNSERKRYFIEAARKFYPNITKCCQEVGISWHTFNAHRKSDPEFAAQLALVKLEVTDRIEGVLAQEAVNPKSFLDRMAYLRAHRPELYDRAKVVKIEGYKMNDGERSSRLNVVDTVIDAEISKSYLSRKEQREKRNQARLSKGDSSSSGVSGGGSE